MLDSYHKCVVKYCWKLVVREMKLGSPGLFLDICRVHAEFQLNEEPNYPFWFTPSQFTGRLVIDSQWKHVHHFSLSVPTTKQLNVGE